MIISISKVEQFQSQKAHHKWLYIKDKLVYLKAETGVCAIQEELFKFS